MSKHLKIAGAVACAILIGYFLFGYLSSFVGWYGYKKWKYRRATTDIEESKSRGVFVKELQFQFENFPDTIVGFVPYIEKGFKYGLHSSEETVLLTKSNYPYQLSFSFTRSEKTGLQIDEDQLRKFDSCNIVKGFLKQPVLKDTIVVNIIGLNTSGGTIKIWD